MTYVRSRTPVRWALSLSVAMAVLAACTAPRSHFPLTRYVPVNRDLAPLGELHLSNTQLRLGALEGEMKLQYVGQITEAAGTDMAGGSVYRVKNADGFFKKNEGRNAWCNQPPRWIVVNSETGAPAWSSEIFVGLLTVKEWSAFKPDDNGYCGGGRYVRARS